MYIVLAWNLLLNRAWIFVIPLNFNVKGNIMQKSKLLVAVLGTLIAMPALAEDSPFSANVSLTSNYLFRGMSQTGTKPALQGGFDYANPNGFYAGVWASSISWISDAGSATNAGTEIDTYLGFSSTFATDFTYDVGILRYNYPGTYVAGATKADTNEIYGSIGYKWITAKYSRSLGDTFGIPSASGSDYFQLDASYPIESAGITLGAHYGKQKFKGTAANALRTAGTDPDYHDYNLSVSKDVSGYDFALMYSKTNATAGGFWTDPQGHNLGKGTAVLSVSHSF
jgi:uncharacterized protein (TIGR02001 family)